MNVRAVRREETCDVVKKKSPQFQVPTGPSKGVRVDTGFRFYFPLFLQERLRHQTKVKFKSRGEGNGAGEKTPIHSCRDEPGDTSYGLQQRQR